MEHYVGVRRASQMRERFIDSSHVDRIARLDFEGNDLHVLGGQVAVSPHRSTDKIGPRPPAAGSFSSLRCGYLNGERLDLPFSSPRWLQRGFDRFVKLCFVKVGERRLTDMCCLVSCRRRITFFKQDPADGTAASLRSCDSAFF